MLEPPFYKVVGLQLYQKQTPAQAFSSEYREIFKDTYFEKHLRMVAFVHLSCFIHYHFPNSYRAVTILQGPIFLGLNFQGGGGNFL